MTRRRMWNRGWLLTIVVMIVFALVIGASGAGRAAAQQDEVDRARYNAEQWLLRRLGKPGMLLVEYTYAGTSWPTTAMGCPQPGVTYEDETVNGYRWTFLFENLVRYEVHSSLDGTEAVLCRSQNAAGELQLERYAGMDFALLAPEAWLVFPDDAAGEVLFAPQPEPTCADPGMRAAALGRVTAGTSPDQLLDERLRALDVEPIPDSREASGAFGRAVEYTTPCDDGTRQWRLTVFVQNGDAYRVEQWADAAEFDRWRAAFRNMLSQFTPGNGLAPTEATDTASEPTPPPADAAATESAEPPGEEVAAAPLLDPAALPGYPLALSFVGDVFLGALNDTPGRSVTNLPEVAHRYIAFSPDGLALSYIDVETAQLRVLPVENVTPRKLAEDVDPAFPPAWSPDSAQIAIVRDPGEADAEGRTLRAIEAVPAEGGEPQTLGTFPYTADCDAALTDPADRALYAEIGPGGVQPVLAWLPGGQFVVSTGCAGGLALFDPASGQIAPLGDDLRGGILSPDRARFLARAENGLVLIDLPAGTRTALGVGAEAGALAWAPDGASIYVATAALAESQTLDDPADQVRGEAAFGFWPVTAGVYDLALVQVDLATLQAQTRWQRQGRAIGQIAPAPDGSGVLFSVIPSSLPMIEVFQAGGDAFALETAQPAPTLFWLAEGTDVAVLVAYAGQPAFAPLGSGAP